MDFAPYQDTNPEQERALSPPPRRSLSRSPRPQSPTLPNIADPFTRLPPPDHFSNSRGYQEGGDVESGRVHVDLFETSLPMRMDYEAMLAYLLLPPAGGVMLLLVEHKSDYVRFHAWQSSMLFSAVFLIHLIFSFSAFISWLLFVLDVAGIAFLALRAYRDADTLDRFEVPFIGRWASAFVDDE